MFSFRHFVCIFWATLFCMPGGTILLWVGTIGFFSKMLFTILLYGHCTGLSGEGDAPLAWRSTVPLGMPLPRSVSLPPFGFDPVEISYNSNENISCLRKDVHIMPRSSFVTHRSSLEGREAGKPLCLPYLLTLLTLLIYHTYLSYLTYSVDFVSFD